MVVIGISDLFALYNSFYVTSWKILDILKAIYPLAFHSCFIVFMSSRSNGVLTYTSIVCLTVFLLGSVHHLLEAVIRAIRWVIKALKKNVNCLKVKPANDLKDTSNTLKKEEDKPKTKGDTPT